MWNDARDAYLESRVLAADPVELIALLYQACTARVREARTHLVAGRILERSQSINRAHEILTELSASLDFDRGGEISQRLSPLYHYMQRRLLEANVEQSDARLVEVLGLLATLNEAWEGVGRQLARTPSAETGWVHATDEPVTAQAWSF